MTLVVAGLALALIWWMLVKKLCGLQFLEKLLQQSTGYLLEIGVYKDQPGSIGSVLGSILKHGWLLVKALFLPCLFFLLFLVPILGTLSTVYSRRPVTPGQSVLLTARAAEGFELTSVTLVLPQEVQLDCEPILDQSRNEKIWRLSSRQSGSHILLLDSGGRRHSLRMQVGGDKLSPSTGKSSHLYRQFLNPFTGYLRSSDGLKAIELEYPAKPLWVGSRQLHWMVPFTLCFLLLAGLCRRLF